MYTFTFNPYQQTVAAEVISAPAPAPKAEVVAAPAPAQEQKAEAERVRSHKQSYLIFCATGRKDEEKEMSSREAWEFISLIEKSKRLHGYPTRVRAFQASAETVALAKGKRFLADWVRKGAWVARSAEERARVEGAPAPTPAKVEKKATKGGIAALKRAVKALVDAETEEANLRALLALLQK